MYAKKTCLKCGKETKNRKFCSRSCATSVNNVSYKKREKTLKRHCQECGGPVWIYRRKRCQDCNSLDKLNPTIAEISIENKAQRHARIREHARRKYQRKHPRGCLICEYDKHIEVAHIKPVAKFNENQRLSEVNDYANLAGLCPNCHWELDHKLLDVSIVQAAVNKINNTG